MASELRVNTLKDASGNNSVGMSYVAEGSGKAWANYSGSGTTFRDSFNCASATDNGAGDYTTTFTNAMNNDDYSFSVGIRLDSGADAAYSVRGLEVKTPAAGSIRFVCQVGAGGSSNDFDHTCPQIMGDLA
tara:strand:+ start:748 stop:1140 length:393 start_codon:yes stop_codon:yes gene_type:complete